MIVGLLGLRLPEGPRRRVRAAGLPVDLAARALRAASSSRALLDEQPMGFYPPDALVHEAQRRGIEVRAADVNASQVGCVLEGDAVRVGLGYVQGVRADEVAGASSTAREARRPVRTVEDLAARAGAGRRVTGEAGVVRAPATRWSQAMSHAGTPAPRGAVEARGAAPGLRLRRVRGAVVSRSWGRSSRCRCRPRRRPACRS